MKISSVEQHIKSAHKGDLKAFAKSMKASVRQVKHWITREFIVINNILYSPKKDLKVGVSLDITPSEPSDTALPSQFVSALRDAWGCGEGQEQSSQERFDQALDDVVDKGDYDPYIISIMRQLRDQTAIPR